MTIRALIVDDSALIRKLLSDILSQDPNLRVVGTVFNGKDGLEKIKKLRPDVILLDNVMPVLDGLKTLARIMKECPTPVVMISALGKRAEEITLTAFEYGAVDVIQKPEGILSQNMPDMAEEICRKTRAAAKANLENLECMRNRELEEPNINKREKIEKHRSWKRNNGFREKCSCNRRIHWRPKSPGEAYRFVSCRHPCRSPDSAAYACGFYGVSF